MRCLLQNRGALRRSLCRPGGLGVSRRRDRSLQLRRRRDAELRDDLVLIGRGVALQQRHTVGGRNVLTGNALAEDRNVAISGHA